MRVIRKLLPSDGSAYLDHLLRLDPADRQFRFGGGLGDAAVRAHCERIDWFRAAILGWFDEGGVLRAAAELRFDGTPPPVRVAELALSVERGWQGHGIGGELLRRAIILARNRGIRRVTMLCLAENRRMRRLAGRFADGGLQAEGGQIEAAIPVPPPTPSSVIAEFAADGIDLVAAWWEGALLPQAAA
jgi:GNAT superfamily N-acetyltransferase